MESFPDDGAPAAYRVLRRVAGRIRDRARAARTDLFLRTIRPVRGARVLDLGGGDGAFLARIREHVDLDVVVADIAETTRMARQLHGFKAVRLEEGVPLPFRDGAFDIVFANSVIEHVTLPAAECVRPGIAENVWRERSFAAQRRFAEEIRRVGRAYFVQTPHRAFPVDAHTWLPLTNLLPHDAARRLVRITDRYWVKRCGIADWHLLGSADMRALFPDATLHIERWAGLPKSIVAWRA